MNLRDELVQMRIDAARERETERLRWVATQRDNLVSWFKQAAASDWSFYDIKDPRFRVKDIEIMFPDLTVQGFQDGTVRVSWS